MVGDDGQGPACSLRACAYDADGVVCKSRSCLFMIWEIGEEDVAEDGGTDVILPRVNILYGLVDMVWDSDRAGAN